MLDAESLEKFHLRSCSAMLPFLMQRGRRLSASQQTVFFPFCLEVEKEGSNGVSRTSAWLETEGAPIGRAPETQLCSPACRSIHSVPTGGTTPHWEKQKNAAADVLSSAAARCLQKNPPLPPGGTPTEAQRVRFGEEEQRHERALTFKKSRSARYKACSDAGYRNSIDAAASRFAPKTKSQPSVSGCDLERRSSGMSAL